MHAERDIVIPLLSVSLHLSVSMSNAGTNGHIFADPSNTTVLGFCCFRVRHFPHVAFSTLIAYTAVLYIFKI